MPSRRISERRRELGRLARRGELKGFLAALATGEANSTADPPRVADTPPASAAASQAWVREPVAASAAPEPVSETATTAPTAAAEPSERLTAWKPVAPETPATPALQSDAAPIREAEPSSDGHDADEIGWQWVPAAEPGPKREEHSTWMPAVGAPASDRPATDAAAADAPAASWMSPAATNAPTESWTPRGSAEAPTAAWVPVTPADEAIPPRAKEPAWIPVAAKESTQVLREPVPAQRQETAQPLDEPIPAGAQEEAAPAPPRRAQRFAIRRALLALGVVAVVIAAVLGYLLGHHTSGAKSPAPANNSAYATNLNGVLSKLNSARSRATKQMKTARNPAAQAAAARNLATAHVQAASSLQRLAAGNASGANTALISALRGVGRAYAAIGAALKHGNARAERAANASLSAANQKLRSAFSQLQSLGYRLA